MSQANSPSVVAARLEGLLSTIEQSVAELKKHLAQQTQSKPDHTRSHTSYPFYEDPSVASHASLLKLACERLGTLVTPPHVTVMEQSSSFFTTAAIQIVVKHNVAQHIHDLSEGEHGAPIKEVAEAAMLDGQLLSRILRYLSHKGIFQEDGPTRFKNTTASLTLTNDPEFKAFIDLLTTEVHNGSSKLGEYMAQQHLSSKDRPEDGKNSYVLPSPFNMYTGLPIYQWLHQPENAERSQNFNQGMRGLARSESFASIPFDYPFKELPYNTTIVDVGGGIGALAEMILPPCPNLKMVVQDLPPVIKAAIESPSDIIKQCMDEGRLRFEAHDFLVEQKEEKRGNVFLLCNVLLNQSDKISLQILKCIRRSNPYRLLIVDRFYGPFFPVEANTPEAERDIYSTIQLASQNRQPTTNRPGSQSVTGVFDMIMASMFVTKTRTEEQWAELLNAAGYVFVSVTPIRASSGHVVIEAQMQN